jgi:hypothetical protein
VNWVHQYLRLGRSGRLLLIFSAVLLLAAEAFGQTSLVSRVRIAEAAWGFDGRVTAGEFQPVSLLLDNLSSDAVEGVLTMQMLSGVLRRAGAVYEQPVFLGPSARRWVQFYPWISDPNATWQLELRTAVAGAAAAAGGAAGSGGQSGANTDDGEAYVGGCLSAVHDSDTWFACDVSGSCA